MQAIKFNLEQKQTLMKELLLLHMVLFIGCLEGILLLNVQHEETQRY